MKRIHREMIDLVRSCRRAKGVEEREREDEVGETAVQLDDF